MKDNHLEFLELVLDGLNYDGISVESRDSCTLICGDIDSPILNGNSPRRSSQCA
jgi:hypothetical protein